MPEGAAIPAMVWREAGLAAELLGGGLAREALGELLLDAADERLELDDVGWRSDGRCGQGDAAVDRLPDPVGGVGGEPAAGAPVVAIGGADEADGPLLDEVREGEPAAAVALRD